MRHRNALCRIVPPYLLEQIAARAEAETAECARRSLERDRVLRGDRGAGRLPEMPAVTPRGEPGASGHPNRTISDAQGQETLPGTVVRREGEPETADAAADEAYAGLGLTWELYSEAFGRDSLDGQGLPLLGTVHYGQDYDNAFWDGTQMVFGDGDGRIFNRFTVSVDVVGHELTHGVTEHTAAMAYQGQSGALNESVSDVFGSLVKQRQLGHDAASADWLIGEGLFTDQVQGVALRSMKSPGTAYDDPVLGKDPQPATMDSYVETTDDNGGVHINSGIPNHAFYLAATAIGGNAWEGAGPVWYDVLTGGEVPPDCDFATFADLTGRAAAARFGEGSAQAVAVQDAWIQVGVLAAGKPGGETPESPPGGPVPGPAPGRVPEADAELLVRRSGGVVGMVRERSVVLADLPRQDADDWSALLGGRRLQELADEPNRPDAFVYRVVCPSAGVDLTVHEPVLPGDVRDLIERTLDAGG